MANTANQKKPSRRDNFTKAVASHLARSVNYHCSKCDAPTAGPFSGGRKSITTGVAAHICAAAPLGPRYDPSMKREQRRDYDNGIWLCAAHAPLVDHDFPKYSVADLRKMKLDAESRAAYNLERARAEADLRPRLSGEIEWHPPAPKESRPGFEQLHHAVFRLAGKRKVRGRAFIDVQSVTHPTSRLRACIGEATESLAHEVKALRPEQQYVIPVFTRLAAASKFWLDRRFVPDHPLSPTPAMPIVPVGTYVTDEAFLFQHHRAALPAGKFTLKVVLVLGDVEHSETFESAPYELVVA